MVRVAVELVDRLADEVLRVTGSTAGTRAVPYAEAFGPGFEDLEVRVRPAVRMVGP